YNVLEAGAPDEAMDLAGGYDGSIHLLITDVIMPGMNGRELAEKIQSMRPGIKCMYMSGYTFDVIKHRGMLARNERLVQKPFSIRELALMVRQSIDQDK
ncbi:MAG: response regulator, partial [Thermodesulfobacteriota bacterium]